MSFDPESFTVHDVSAFPVVRPRNAGMTEGYAPQWVSEMEALLARGEPYVLVLEGVRVDEAHEDRKQRGLWLKKNKQALRKVCKALISVEPDALKRAAFRLQAAGAVRAFGIPMDVVASAAEAMACVRRRLEDHPGG